MEAAGSSLENSVKAQVYIEGIENFPDFVEVWNEAFATIPCALTVVPAKSYGTVGGIIEINLIALKAGASRQKRVVEAAIPGMAAYGPCVRAGEFLFPSALMAVGADGAVAGGGAIRCVGRAGACRVHPGLHDLRYAEALCKAAGTSMGNVVRAQYFTVDPREFPGIAAAWTARYGAQPHPFVCVGVPTPLPAPRRCHNRGFLDLRSLTRRRLHCRNPRPCTSPPTCPTSIPIIFGGRRGAGSATRITASRICTRTAPASPRAVFSTCCSSAIPRTRSENHGGTHHAAVRYGMRWPKHDMSPLIPLMARAAAGVGFGMTMSTTYQHPFHVARHFNALDHVTGGRMAWNAVTSAYKNEAANWGYEEMIEHDERYVRAREHMQVACALWDSVEKDAILFDKASGMFADPEKVHLIKPQGKYFNVRGPLPVIPSPQHRPVLIQAGQSPAGIDLAATFAEMQFVGRNTVASMQAHRRRLDERLAVHHRSPRDCGVLWSIRVQVAESEADALEKERRYIAAIPQEAGLIELSHMYGIDFSALRSDMRLADVAETVKAQNVHWGSFQELLDTNDPEMTVGELGRKNAIGKTLAIRGTPGIDRRPDRRNPRRHGPQWRDHPGQGHRNPESPAGVRRASGARTAAPRPDEDAV